MKHKLGVIVPYRNRYRQLVKFKESFHNYMKKNHLGIDYTVIVVEQDDSAAFNRGKLLNIGFLKAKELKCDYVVFHDVDMLPLNVDYSYSNKPIHLATHFRSKGETLDLHFDKYFGGVTLFPDAEFETINGYSNKYWGWGFEDDDLLYRCESNHLPLATKKIETSGANTAALEFNGVDASVEFTNKINTNTDFTIWVSFEPEPYKLDTAKANDRNVIFTIPGYDFAFTYDSFNRYCVEVFDRRGEMIIINTRIKPEYKTNLAVTWSAFDKELSFYQDGLLVDKVTLEERLWNYSKSSKMYLGCSNPDETFRPQTFFTGKIDTFAAYQENIPAEALRDMSHNKHFGLTSKFGSYDHGSSLVNYYDAKFVKHYRLMDLSENGSTGYIENCSIVKYDYKEYMYEKIPHRRESSFTLLDHEPGGYLDGRWKDQLTRYNQLRFSNEVRTGEYDIKNDGLNTLEYKIHSSTEVGRNVQLVVAI
jgi:hypothetical protein